MRERDWKTLIQTYSLLSRLVVQRTKHHRPDDADTLARQALAVEEELEHHYPVRWPRLRAQLLQQQAVWWAEDHDDDALACQACDHSVPERVDVPQLRRVPA